MNRVMKLALVAAAVAFAPQALAAYESENETSPDPTIEELIASSGYETLRGAAGRLRATGEGLSAIRLLEDFGDVALAQGTVELAERAYQDAAWVAAQVAAEARVTPLRTQLFLLGYRDEHAESVRNGFSAEAERLFRKAQEAANSA